MTARPPSDQESLRALQQLDTIGIVRWDAACPGVHMSPAARRLLDQDMDAELEPRELLGRLEPQERRRLCKRWELAIDAREPRLSADVSVFLEDGSTRQLRALAVCNYGADGRLTDCIVCLRDVSDQQVVAKALSESQSRLEEAQEIAGFGFWEWHYKGEWGKCSQEALRMLRKPPDWIPNLQGLQELVPDDQRAWVMSLYSDAFGKRTTTLRYEVRHTDPDGHVRDIHTLTRITYAPDGKPERLLATIQDISQLKSYRKQLHSLSFFDPLTQLPNRALFVDRLGQALAEAEWHDQHLGVMMLDIDRFKDINDSLGHGAGDQLLKQTAQRLQNALRGYDTIARLGGDEFAVLLPEVRQAADLGSIAAKVLKAFSAPFTVGDQDIFVTASIGGALYPLDAKNADQLLQYADAALYSAKSKGRNNYRFYSEELTAQASERVTLESELRRGIERHELELYYQPKFELATGRLVGAEALMRWNHPKRGLVPPMSFIPLAEDTGLIVPMGEWALRTAGRAAAGWNREAADPMRLAVNLSARQLAGMDFARTVRNALRDTGCRPEWLELEITESMLLDGREDVRSILEQLAAQGITIAIDDFGTGYSALSYLTRFPVQILKIDRSFVQEITTGKGGVELIKAIVSLGRSLNMTLVAEGVETPEQAAYLNSLGCHLVQGFLYGRPMTHAAFSKLIIRP